MNTYQDVEITVSTKDTVVNATGVPIEPEYNEQGELVNGIKQLNWYQNVPISLVPNEDGKLASYVYKLLEIAMVGYDSRKSV